MANGLHRPHPLAVPLSETIEAWTIIASLVFAVWFVKTDIVLSLITLSAEFSVLASFVAGLFFTSVLTTIPALVAVVEIATYVPAWEVAFFGGVGAVCGDVLVFRFVRSGLVERIMRAAIHPRVRTVGKVIASGPLWWVAPVFGAILIASPLPDELGLFMMGISHIRAVQFIPLVFVANMAGIFIIAQLAQNIP